MNQHHPEDSKDSLIVQQQVQHQELLDQHQQHEELNEDEVDNVRLDLLFFYIYATAYPHIAG